MSRNVWLVLGASLALAGCQHAPKEESQYDDSRNPLYKQAQQDLDGNNPNAAVSDYEAALAADPKLAGAHYNLGLIYADKLNDPIGALYHFHRYLQLAPNSDKADEVKTAIDKQSQAFVATLPAPAAPSADVTTQLQADNASLKKQVEDATHTIVQLQAQLAKAGKHHSLGPTGMAVAVPPPAVQPPPPPAAASTVATTTPATTNAAPAAPPRAMPVDAATAAAPAPADTSASPVSSGPARSYKIVSGDSLWKISHKMYPGDTKNGIDRIKDANKDILVPGKPLKIGQVLVIP